MSDYSQAESIEQLLSSLRQHNPDIAGALIITSEGFTVASDLAQGMDEEALAAVCADLVLHAHRSVKEVGGTAADELYVRSATGYILAFGISEEAVFMALASSNVSLGLLVLECRRAAKVAAALL
jgi:predicted regulator of Ras-like GTPase activity (Roadblock/LC7/MglB family)